METKLISGKLISTWIVCICFFGILAGVLEYEKSTPELLILSTGFAFLFYLRLYDIWDTLSIHNIKIPSLKKDKYGFIEVLSMRIFSFGFICVPIIVINPHWGGVYSLIMASSIVAMVFLALVYDFKKIKEVKR